MFIMHHHILTDPLHDFPFYIFIKNTGPETPGVMT